MTRKTPDPAESDPRKDRLAAALRANLRRRKAQERAQGEGEASPLPDPDPQSAG